MHGCPARSGCVFCALGLRALNLSAMSTPCVLTFGNTKVVGVMLSTINADVAGFVATGVEGSRVSVL